MEQLQWKALPKVTSFVGAGGKTTVMYALACRLAGEGKKVAVMTTTHIHRPDPGHRASSLEMAERLWQSGKFAVIGEDSSKPGKLKAPDPALLSAILQKADHILVEADGARRHPIKVPRVGEPVILPETELVMAVMGASAIGKPLGECCFGLQEAMALLRVQEEHILTPADAAAILSSVRGGRKNVENRRYGVIINQCDDAFGMKTGGEIAFSLNSIGIKDVYLTSFSDSQRRLYSTLAGADNEA